jgi:hypothetical protein
MGYVDGRQVQSGGNGLGKIGHQVYSDIYATHVHAQGIFKISHVYDPNRFLFGLGCST